MIIHELGRENDRVIVILHDEEHTDWDNNDILKKCAGSYHLVMLSLGENESEDVLFQYLNDYYHNHVYAICAFQNEWRVFTILMNHKEVVYVKMVVEGKSVSSGKMIEKYICEM